MPINILQWKKWLKNIKEKKEVKNEVSMKSEDAYNRKQFLSSHLGERKHNVTKHETKDGTYRAVKLCLGCSTLQCNSNALWINQKPIIKEISYIKNKQLGDIKVEGSQVAAIYKTSLGCTITLWYARISRSRFKMSHFYCSLFSSHSRLKKSLII